MLYPSPPKPIPTSPPSPSNPYMNGQLGRFYGYSITASDLINDIPDDPAAQQKYRYDRAVRELRGETRMLLSIAIIGTAALVGAIWALIHFGVLGTVAKYVGFALAGAGAYYGTAELIFRWRRKKFDEEYAIKLMKGEA